MNQPEASFAADKFFSIFLTRRIAVMKQGILVTAVHGKEITVRNILCFSEAADVPCFEIILPEEIQRTNYKPLIIVNLASLFSCLHGLVEKSFTKNTPRNISSHPACLRFSFIFIPVKRISRPGIREHI